MTDVKELTLSDSDMAQLFAAINKNACDIGDLIEQRNSQISHNTAVRNLLEEAGEKLRILGRVNEERSRIVSDLHVRAMEANERLDKLERHVESMEKRLLTHQGLLNKLTAPAVITPTPRTDEDAADARRYRMLQSLNYPEAMRLIQYKKVDCDRMLDRMMESKTPDTCDEGGHVWVHQRNTAVGAEYKCAHCHSIRELGVNF